jgi:hypothetical protein
VVNGGIRRNAAADPLEHRIWGEARGSGLHLGGTKPDSSRVSDSGVLCSRLVPKLNSRAAAVARWHSVAPACPAVASAITLDRAPAGTLQSGNDHSGAATSSGLRRNSRDIFGSGSGRTYVGQARVPRTRSSHIPAATAHANFGFKRGTSNMDLLVSSGAEVRNRAGSRLVRTSEPGHWRAPAIHPIT